MSSKVGQLWYSFPSLRGMGSEVFESGYLTHFLSERDATKFGSFAGLAIGHLFAIFGELWSGVARYHAAGRHASVLH